MAALQCVCGDVFTASCTIVACFTPSARRRRRAPGGCAPPRGRGRLGVIEIIRACSLIRAQSTALK
eukprot:COSAG03_NODE_19084_length_343_cov_0.602459_2_plen_65_part_01